MIGVDCGKSYDCNDFKVMPEKGMIERETHEGYFGMKSIEESSSFSRVAQSTQLCKPGRGIRPCHIIEVAHDNIRRSVPLCFFAISISSRSRGFEVAACCGAGGSGWLIFTSLFCL